MPIPPPPPKPRYVNQAGQDIVEERLFTWGNMDASEADTAEAIQLILEHLNKKIVRTNATKHGNTEIVMKDAD